MRIAWLPVILILVFNMASIFATLSIAVGRVITFEDTSWAGAQFAYGQLLTNAWTQNPATMVGITAATFFINLILISSFMAPLTRYAASGIKPAPGLFTAGFGSQEVRYAFASTLSGYLPLILIFAPALFTLYYLNKIVSKTYLSFPRDDSIHTVTPVNLLGQFIEGKLWVFGLPVSFWLLIAPLVILFIGLIYRHFHPKRRITPFSNAEITKPYKRLIIVSVLGLAFLAFGWAFVVGYIPQLQFFRNFLLLDQNTILDKATWPAVVVFVTLISLISYLTIRLFSYPGHAVMDGTLSLKRPLRTSRGWNLFKIVGLFILFTIITMGVQIVINIVLSQAIIPVLQSLYVAFGANSRVFNSGVTAEWLFPFFVWLLAAVSMLFNIFWMFFSYGALAGLYGRLYVHSEDLRPYTTLY